MKEKTREEIKEEYKWDLSSYFKNDEELKQTVENVKNRLPELEKMKGHILDSASTLYEALKLESEINQAKNKVYVYAHLRFYEDMASSETGALVNLSEKLFKEVTDSESFINPEILKADYDKILQFIKEESRLKDYAFYLENMFRDKKHYLSEKEEKILNVLETTFPTYLNMFSSLVASEIDAGYIVNKKGEEVKLNLSTLNDLLREEDREFRKKVYNQFWDSYNKNGATLSNLLINSTNMATQIAHLRGYKSVLDKELFHDNVSKKLFDNIINTISRNSNLYAKFFQIRKDKMKLDKLEPWDLGVELSNKTVKKYTIEEAKEIVMDALSILGEEYQSILKKAFEERWIDYMPSKGRYLGWFSWGVYGSNPVVFLNFNKEAYDVSGMAHELGHAVHDYYAFENNEYINHEYSLFVAEIVSLTNELIVSNYMLEISEDKNEKINLIERILKLINTNTFSVVIATHLEKFIYDKQENKESISDKDISDKYLSLLDEFRHGVIKSDKVSAHAWAINTQYFEEYYFYKYAVGMICALTLVERLKTKEGREKYFEFLKMGENYPMEELKVLGIDLEDPSIIENAMNEYKKYLDKYEELLNS